MQCNRVGCAERALWRAGFSFTAKSAPNGVRAKADTTLFLCSVHKKEATIDEFMTEEGWLAICDRMARHGFAEPSRASLRLEWKPLGH